MAEVAAKAESIEDGEGLEAPAGSANVLRSCELGLKCVASGVRRRGRFCEIRGRQHFPPSEGAVLAWAAYFVAGRKSQQFLPRQEKARALLGRSIVWKTEAVSQAAMGFARSANRIHSPMPEVSRSLLMKILTKNLSAREIVQAEWVGWLFLLPVQSECLRLVRQLPRERTEEDSAPRHQPR